MLHELSADEMTEKTIVFLFIVLKYLDFSRLKELLFPFLLRLFFTH